MRSRLCLGLLSGVSVAAAFGSFTVQAQPVPAGKSGETVYREVCMACHATGVAKAPRFGSQQDWGKLIAEGQPVLTAHAWVGVRAMPAKGGKPDLSLEEFARATAFMARAAGGKWQDPDAKMLARIQDEERKRLAALKLKEPAKP